MGSFSIVTFLSSSLGPDTRDERGRVGRCRVTPAAPAGRRLGRGLTGRMAEIQKAQARLELELQDSQLLELRPRFRELLRVDGAQPVRGELRRDGALLLTHHLLNLRER